MFEHVYHNENVKKVEDLAKVEIIVESLYNYYLKHPEKLPSDLYEMIPEFGEQEIVKDYIAGMTDRFAMNQYTEIFMPKGL